MFTKLENKNFSKKVKEFNRKLKKAQTVPCGMLHLYLENEIKLGELLTKGKEKLELRNKIKEVEKDLLNTIRINSAYSQLYNSLKLNDNLYSSIMRHEALRKENEDD